MTEKLESQTLEEVLQIFSDENDRCSIVSFFGTQLLDRSPAKDRPNATSITYRTILYVLILFFFFSLKWFFQFFFFQKDCFILSKKTNLGKRVNNCTWTCRLTNAFIKSRCPFLSMASREQNREKQLQSPWHSRPKGSLYFRTSR